MCPLDNAPLKKRADDQSMDSINERFEAYNDDTMPILSEYKAEGKLIEIDGTKPIEEVTASIISHLS